MFLQCSLHDYKMLKYLPSLLAAGTAFVAVKISAWQTLHGYVYLFISLLFIFFVIVCPCMYVWMPLLGLEASYLL